MNDWEDGDESVRIAILKVIASTRLARLVRLNEDDERVWIPKSETHSIDGEEIWIPKWLADVKGLEYD